MIIFIKLTPQPSTANTKEVMAKPLESDGWGQKPASDTCQFGDIKQPTKALQASVPHAVGLNEFIHAKYCSHLKYSISTGYSTIALTTVAK